MDGWFETWVVGVLFERGNSVGRTDSLRHWKSLGGNLLMGCGVFVGMFGLDY